MVGLPAGAIERIAEAQRHAEANLRKALSDVGLSEDPRAKLPAVKSFVSDRIDAEARELLAVCGSAEQFRRLLEDEVALRAVETVLPDESLGKLTGVEDKTLNGVSIECDVDTGLFSEIGLDGVRRPARPEILAIFAPHGALENLLGVQVMLRGGKSNPRNALIREVLQQAVHQRITYWVGQFELLPSAGVRGTGTKVTASVAQYPKRAQWLEARLAERGWSKHDLERHGGPEHRTIQKILDGLKVQEDVLSKVIRGLQAKPAHKGRTLPPVAESDIPND